MLNSVDAKTVPSAKKVLLDSKKIFMAHLYTISWKFSNFSVNEWFFDHRRLRFSALSLLSLSIIQIFLKAVTVYLFIYLFNKHLSSLIAYLTVDKDNTLWKIRQQILKVYIHFLELLFFFRFWKGVQSTKERDFQ